MPEKRKTEETELQGGNYFPAKRARQQISYDDLDDSGTSNPVKRSNVAENDSHTNVSEGEDGDADWDNKNTTNKQNKYKERHNQQSRVDPVYGQRSAFPGLDDAGSDELLYGPPEDGLEYLRLVRSEAKSLPSLFIAPKKPKTEQDQMHDTEEVLEHNEVCPTSQRVEEKEQTDGFVFIDGVVIARSKVEESKLVNAENTRDAQTSYYDLLKHRFILLRSTLRCSPPATAIAELDDAHPITLPYNVNAARTAWRQLLFTSEPQMAQLACMDMETILGVLRLLGSVVIKCVKDNDSTQLRRVGAWAWGLLGRCRDVGELGSEEVGELRVFGRKAANILKRLNSKKNPLIKRSIAESDSDSEEFSDEEMGESEDANQMDTRKEAIQEETLVQETAANDELPVPTVESAESEELQASADLETAKFRLRSMLFSGEDDEELEAEESEAENAEIRRRNTSSASEEEEEGDDEVSEKEVNPNKTPLPKRAEGEKQTRILLDMIITIVGELYGQKDLLEQRDIWA